MSQKSLINFALLFFLPQVSILSHASSISLTFNISAVGSGHSLYACNAGLWTDSTSGTVGRDVITGSDCTASLDNQNCLTIDPSGSEILNTLVATYGPWSGTTTPTTVTITSATSNAGSSGVVFAIGNTSSWTSKLGTVTFTLGSVLQNASFFVDLCYRSPQIEYHQSYGSSMPFKWQLRTDVTEAVISGSDGRNSYASAAGLVVTSRLVCDTQGLGTYIWATNGTGASPTAGGGVYNSANFERDITETNLSTFSGDFLPSAVTASVPIAGTSTLHTFTAGQVTVSSTHRAPRFCKIRYYFQENGTLRLNTAVGSLVTLKPQVNTIP